MQWACFWHEVWFNSSHYHWVYVLFFSSPTANETRCWITEGVNMKEQRWLQQSHMDVGTPWAFLYDAAELSCTPCYSVCLHMAPASMIPGKYSLLEVVKKRSFLLLLFFSPPTYTSLWSWHYTKQSSLHKVWLKASRPTALQLMENRTWDKHPQDTRRLQL